MTGKGFLLRYLFLIAAAVVASLIAVAVYHQLPTRGMDPAFDGCYPPHCPERNP